MMSIFLNSPGSRRWSRSLSRSKSYPGLVRQAELVQLLLESKHLLLHGIYHRRRFRLEGRRKTQSNLRGLGVRSSSMEGLTERWKGRSNIGRVLERNRGHSCKWRELARERPSHRRRGLGRRRSRLRGREASHIVRGLT